MVENEKISIVIPVYKVEKYLRQCVDSVLKQTYRDIEVILVDDGSPDRCGEICDQYQKKDKRIKVIHQHNKGLSEARTAATNIAVGKYITFLDGDDWFERDLLERLHYLIKEYNADVSVAAFCYTDESGSPLVKTDRKPTISMNRIEALKCYLFDDKITVCICGKLWKTTMWEGIRCPAGKLFEDHYTTYKLLDKAEKVVFDQTPKYYYRKRVGSIAHTRFSERTYDLYYGIQEQYEYIIHKYPNIAKTMAVAKIRWELVFIDMMLQANYFENQIACSCQKFARKWIGEVFRCPYLSNTRKIQIFLFAYNLPLYKLSYWYYKQKRPI